MRYRWRDVPALLRSAPGRSELRCALAYRSWPVLRLIATMYRRTLLRRTRLIVVVGSLGKTSATKAVAAAACDGVGPRSESNCFGFLAFSLLAIPPWRRRAVLEVGIAAPGQMAAYAAMIRPDIAVVTSIASEHQSSFGSLAHTRHEKAEMLRVLPPSGLAVLNWDDPHVRLMAQETTARVVTYGWCNEADVRGSHAQLRWPAGVSLEVSVAGNKEVLHSRLIGQHMVSALLAAVAVAISEGVELRSALRPLETCDPIDGRMQPVRLANGAVLLRDDCKSPVESVDAALDVLAAIPARRRIVVLGDVTEPPERQGPLYARLGERVGAVATRVFLIGHSAARYRVGTSRTGLPREAVTLCGSNATAALAALRGELRDGDVVLLKGRNAQRLERLALGLQGLDVQCDLTSCYATNQSCSHCAMLTRGWKGHPIVGRQPREAKRAQPETAYWKRFGEQLLSTSQQRTWRAHNDRVVGAVIERWLPGAPRNRVLKTDLFEEAIGDGLSALLRRRARHVTAVEVAPTIARTARARHPDIGAVVGDVRQLPFREATFDLVISTSTLDHFVSRSELRDSLAGLAQQLVPGGELILTLDNLANPVIALRNRMPQGLLLALGLTTSRVGVTCGPRQLARYLGEAGFEVQQITAVLHVPRLLAVRLAAHADRWGQALLAERLRRWFARFESLERLPTRYLTGYFLAARAVKRGGCCSVPNATERP